MCDHAKHNCEGCSSNYSVNQSLEEMEFERGIWKAAFDGDFDKVEKHLTKTDPSKKDERGYTALHYAARNGHFYICAILLESGADPNAQLRGGETALHRAAFVGDEKIVQLLLNFKVDPLICDSDGRTALHKAAQSGKKTAAEILVKACPELKCVRDNRNLLPVDYVKDQEELMKILT